MIQKSSYTSDDLGEKNPWDGAVWYTVFKKVRVRVWSATTKELACAHVCVRTLIWTWEVRACDAKNRRNSHLAFKYGVTWEAIFLLNWNSFRKSWINFGKAKLGDVFKVFCNDRKPGQSKHLFHCNVIFEFIYLCRTHCLGKFSYVLQIGQWK